MSIRKYTVSITLSSILLFSWLNVGNANEISIESQLKEEVDQANLEQEIIAIIAEQIESDIAAATVTTADGTTAIQKSPTTTPSSAAVVTTSSTTETNTAVSSSNTNLPINKQVSENLKKSLQAVVKDAESDINKQISDYRHSVEPKKSAEENKPSAPTQKQVKRSEPEAVPQRKSVEKRIVEQELKPVPKQVAVNSNIRKDKGWIYIGQFTNSSWGEKMLKISNELPKAGKNYLLNASVNIRNARPSKHGGMPKVINILSTGDKIKIINIHSSGKKGHYWALVEWLKRR